MKPIIILFLIISLSILSISIYGRKHYSNYYRKHHYHRYKVREREVTQDDTYDYDRRSENKGKISNEAKLYLENAIETLEQNYFKRKAIDWVDLRKKVFSKAKRAQTAEDTYPAIEYALAIIDDKRVRFIPHQNKERYEEEEVSESPLPRGRIIPPGIAYIVMPKTNSNDKNQMLRYAMTGQTLICKLNKEKPEGWIIDLRNNDTSELWPMLLALGPILGEGKLGGFVYPSGKKTVLRYQSGAVYEEDTVKLKFSGYCRAPARNDKVAVLIDDTTLSAAEGTAIAFIARPKTRFIGGNTFGATTGSESYLLSDGASFVMPNFTFTDRLNHAYGKELKPDEYAEGDQVMVKAKAWVSS